MASICFLSLLHGEHICVEGVDLLALLHAHDFAPLGDGKGGSEQLLGYVERLPGRAGLAGPGQNKLHSLSFF